jgi:hypothetical protein
MADGPQPYVLLPHHEKRRSHRLLLRVPVCIQGKDQQQQVFQEETETMVVSAHGGLIAIATVLHVGDTIILRNKTTNQQVEATVVFLGPMKDGKGEVGFEFDPPAGHFWGVTFPPADWTPDNLAAPEP